MGTPALSALPSFHIPGRSDFSGGGALSALLPQRDAPLPDAAAAVQSNQGEALTEAFERAVYRSLETRQFLSVQYSTRQASLGQEGAGSGSAAGVEAFQWTFDFFEETRLEELAYFKQRTDAVGDNLEGPRQASFFATRQEISARFQLSIAISGAALNGFANTAEGAARSNELLDRLLALTEELLGKADELLDGFFSLLDGGDGEFQAESLNTLFSEFAAGILGLFSGDGAPALNFAGNDGGTGASTNAVQTRSVQLEFKFELSASVTESATVVQQGDPIVLDLDGDGIELTHYQQGARFDLLGTGRAQQTAFVNSGDAFLALDRNGDGIINSGKELFGEQHGARNGFEELRRFDVNGDGAINRHDAVFNELRLFRDNGNGITESGELFSPAEAGVEAILLNYREADERAAGGNRIAQIASYLRSDGRTGRAVDALLNYTA